MAAPRVHEIPVVAIYVMVDVEALKESDEGDQVTESNIDEQFPGGVEAFDAMVRQSINSFDVPDR
jgi:hypothetical protein